MPIPFRTIFLLSPSECVSVCLRVCVCVFVFLVLTFGGAADIVDVDVVGAFVVSLFVCKRIT